MAISSWPFILLYINAWCLYWLLCQINILHAVAVLMKFAHKINNVEEWIMWHNVFFIEIQKYKILHSTTNINMDNVHCNMQAVI